MKPLLSWIIFILLPLLTFNYSTEHKNIDIFLQDGIVQINDMELKKGFTKEHLDSILNKKGKLKKVKMSKHLKLADKYRNYAVYGELGLSVYISKDDDTLKAISLKFNKATKTKPKIKKVFKGIVKIGDIVIDSSTKLPDLITASQDHCSLTTLYVLHQPISHTLTCGQSKVHLYFNYFTKELEKVLFRM